MEVDFHYYCVAVLARSAGFSSADALTVAYASQYVDDSTESEPIRVGALLFDPVRTSSTGLYAFSWSIQKKVYIPFHFLPPAPLRTPEDTFVTRPGGAFAAAVMEQALSEKGPKLLRLCRIGVALHTLADTFAHRGFSGRNDAENDVEAIHFKSGNHWKRLFLENITFDLLPPIGHAQAGTYPDIPYLYWKCQQGPEERWIVRDNKKACQEAARKIFAVLWQAAGREGSPAGDWKELAGQLTPCFALPSMKQEERCALWRERFASLFKGRRFRYNREAWRREALSPRRDEDTAWDDLDRPDFRRLEFPMRPGFYDSPWVQFHRAALKQRHFVLERLL